jgi:hypothetical protein
MADVSKADLQALSDRVRALEADMVLVRLAKALFVISIVALGGAVGTFLYTAGATTNEVKNHADRLAKLEDRLAENQKSNERVIETIIDRFPHKMNVSALISDGKILNVAAGEVTIRTDGPDAMDLSFKLDPETTVEIKGQKATPEDLKPGMAARIVADEVRHALSIVVPPPK